MKQRQRIEHSFGSQLLSAAVAAPVAIGLAALGAVVSVTQWVLAAVTSLAPDLDSSRPRHNAARVRELGRLQLGLLGRLVLVVGRQQRRQQQLVGRRERRSHRQAAPLIGV